MIAVIIGIALVGGMFVVPVASDLETPKYEVVESQGDIEIRQYEPMIIAEVQTEGEREDAIGDGFRLLADYIFGNNAVERDIAMTAPVQQESAEIAMTAPVQQQSAGGSWQVSFVMPSEYTLATLPKPKDGRVSIKEIPSKKFAVVTFSGTHSDENIKEPEKRLMDYVEAGNIPVFGSPKYAFYDPPWTFPPMRRNEVMIEIESRESLHELPPLP